MLQQFLTTFREKFIEIETSVFETVKVQVFSFLDSRNTFVSIWLKNHSYTHKGNSSLSFYIYIYRLSAHTINSAMVFMDSSVVC